jgi:chemotaxis protein histidine kinase CheA
MDGKTDEKYKRLKKNLKKALNENDQLKEDNDKLKTKIDHYKKRLRYLKHERDILIEKIQQLESDSESDSGISDKSSNSDNDSDASDNKRSNHKVKDEQAEDTSTTKRRSRSKRKRGSSVRRAQHVDTDENGNAILPIRLGVMTLLSLGKVVYDRDTFHNERYIFPVGYTLTRRYFSMVKSDEYVNYRCVVRDGGNAPIFEVTPEDAVDKKTSASSPTGAWISIVKAVNEMRNKDHSNSASGPDYFGFTSSTIAKLIQDLPNARKCKNYKWQKFETTSGKSLKKATEAARSELMKMESDRLRDEQLENNSLSVDLNNNTESNKNNNDQSDNTNIIVKSKEEEEVDGEDNEDMIEDSQDNNQEETEEVETETTHDEDEEMDEIEEDEDDNDNDNDDEEQEDDHNKLKKNKNSSPKKKKENKSKDIKKRDRKKESIETNDIDEDEEEDEIENNSDSFDSDNNTKASIANESQITTQD